MSKPFWKTIAHYQGQRLEVAKIGDRWQWSVNGKEYGYEPTRKKAIKTATQVAQTNFVFDGELK